MNIMKHAWAMAKRFANIYGGSSKEYLPGCLRMAHGAAKNISVVTTDTSVKVFYNKTLICHVRGDLLEGIIRLGRFYTITGKSSKAAKMRTLYTMFH